MLRRAALVALRVNAGVREQLDLGRVTWHQFRHVHSSLLNDLKIPAKIAQEQLGHARISTALGIYTHVIDTSHRSPVEAVEEKLFGESDANGRKFTATLETAAPVRQQGASGSHAAHDEMAVGTLAFSGRLPIRRATASIASSWRCSERGSAHGP